MKRIIGLPFGAVSRARSFLFDKGLLRRWKVSIPVVSVGNISTGGTGKTPLVMLLLKMFRERGLNPAVLSRGYKKARGEALNDEGKLIGMRFPGILQVQDPDRVKAARMIESQGVADLIILDDGFQHRYLERDIDILCLDCSRPYYRDSFLPAGRLREGKWALRRADLIVVTHTEACPGEAVGELERRARADSSGKPVIFARHEAREFYLGGKNREGERFTPDYMKGKDVFLFSAVGNHESFRKTVESTGAHVAGEMRFRDHKFLTTRDLERVRERAAALDAKAIITTEKDFARTRHFPFRVYVLAVDMRITKGMEKLENLLAEIGDERE